MDDFCLHGVEVVEVGAESEQLVDVEVEGILFVDAGEGGVAVGTHDQEEVVR